MIETKLSTAYGQIAGQLRDRLAHGLLKPDTLLPSERELQAEFDASRGTVRRALKELIDSGWAESRSNRGVVGKIGSKANTGLIGFVDHSGLMHRSFVLALGQHLEERGLKLVHVDSTSRGTEGALEYCVAEGFDAAVVWLKTGFPDADRIKPICKIIPVIAVDHGLRNVATDLVTSDGHAGAKVAIKHLVDLGRKRIAVSGWFDNLDVNQDRFAGYLDGLLANGLQPTTRDFLFCATSGMSYPDTQPLTKRMEKKDHPDAVFVLQDFMAPAVLAAIAAAGRRVPDEVAVVSFGNELAVPVGSGGLTSVAIDWNGIAKACAERIQSRRNKMDEMPAWVAVPVELVVRGSCGAPKERWSDRPCQLYSVGQ